ncbi:MAG: hypothetical protein A2494_00980 [Candidatus Lloydbacteria bacterium RIFOXYC12_FULL_46_25]|uniref:Peptidoglycan binding-like domain-containing protein n=1 Tax=Candidatus Lloydbacteria bacterium RIFOXYC12_FULL_46_25 TaxID=1798670 RepID=A0A1G2E3K2_9BACT|nr:MAG: hypothetical protein A2494_00980 [Candidatus Lloydbacteria bacterium RIFOXYC12_FULL_46_25]
MMNFKNSKTAKAISGIVGIATAVMMMGPSVASAATVEELTAQINALLAQVSALQAAQTTTTTTSSSCTASFTKNLKMGMTDAEVMALQKVLNASADTQVSASGSGSKGNETSYFGGLTKAAVIKFQEKNAAAILTPNGLTAGTGFVGASTRAELNKACSSTSSTTTTTTTTTGTGVSATLDTTSPAASTLISPQGVATLAVFKLTNAGSAAAKVTMMKFQRTGISSDSTLNNVYLYQGSARLTDSASIATGMISFTDTAGLVTIPAGGSVAVAVRADVASSMSGQTVGVMLTEVTTDAGTVTGLPVSGAQHTMADGTNITMTTANFTSSFSPNSGAIDPQNDFVVWQNSLSIGSRDANLSSIRFQQLGSVGTDDVQNFRLMIDGVAVGSAVEKVDANRYVTFALPTPVVVKSGTHVVKVMADIVGGSTRNVQLSLRRAIDVEMTDSQLGIAVSPTTGTGFTAIQGTSAVTINAGALTITKATDSPSGNMVLQGSGVTLAKYTLHAAGEKMKVENLKVGFDWNASTTVLGKLRNGAIFANGVQIGSTQDIVTTGTTFNLGSSLEIMPGTDVTLEVRADVYNSGAGGQYAANDTLKVTTLPGTSNVYGRSSYQYTSTGVVAANQVTVAAGSVTLAKYSAYANQTTVVPQTAYKIGDFRLTTGSTEGINLDTITLDLTPGTVTETDLSNVYVVYGSKTTTTKSAGAATQSWSISESVAANTTLNVAVYATLSGSIATSTTIIPTVTMSGTSQASGNAVASASVQGQTITVGAGSITSAVDASTPVSALVVANSMPKVASFKFTTSNEAYTITELTAKVASAADAAAIKNIVFKDGGTTIATQPMNGVSAAATGLTVSVPLNSSKIIDAYADLDGIGTGFASTSVNVGVTLDSFKYRNSNGVESTDGTDRAGNAMYAYKTKPTITNAALPSSVLASGLQTIGKITITADAGGTIAWRKIVWNYATATPSGTVTLTGPILTDESGTTITGLDFSITGAGKITASSTAGAADQEVSGSKTYILKATVGGTGLIAGASVTTNIASSGIGFVNSAVAASVGATATFVWSDESSSPHSELTMDWNNDYLVKNIPTDTQSLTK